MVIFIKQIKNIIQTYIYTKYNRYCFNNYFIMPQRKAWTSQEDKTLKLLKEELDIRRWSVIAKKMAEEFSMPGRTGKQCRERYHNHLDSSISRTEWTRGQQKNLYALHDEIGNKWVIIAQRLPGRTDNCVKNHFYSRMRKAIRKLNKTIHNHFKKECKEIKMPVLYKIVQATDQKFKNYSGVGEETCHRCCRIKNMLLMYSNDDNNGLDDDLQKLRQLAISIHQFSANYKQKQKRARKNSENLKDLLQLPRIQRKERITSENRSEQMEQFSNSLNLSEYDEELSQNEVQQESIKQYNQKQDSQSNRQQVKSKPKEQNGNSQTNLIRPPVIQIPIRTTGKIPTNIDDDNSKLASMLRNQGILECVDMKKSGLRRQDSYNISDDQSGKRSNSMLEQSVRGVKNFEQNLSNLNLSVELDQQHKLFVSN